MSPISDGCGFDNFENLKGPNDPMNDGAKFDWTTPGNENDPAILYPAMIKKMYCLSGKNLERFGKAEENVSWMPVNTRGGFIGATALAAANVGATIATEAALITGGAWHQFLGRTIQKFACSTR